MKHRPKILLIGFTPPPYNGMSIVMENLLESDLRNDFELILLDIADRRGLKNVGRFDLHNAGLAVRHGMTFLWYLLIKQPDIVYVCIAQNTLGFLRDLLFLLPARLFGKKVVVHLHGSEFREFYFRCSKGYKTLIRWSLAGIRRAVVLGESLRPVFDGLVPRERVEVIPNGVSPPLHAEEVPGQGTHPVVLFLGTLMRTKGFLDLLYSIPAILDEVPETFFILAGEHCYSDEMQDAVTFIINSGIKHNVRMPGIVTGKDKHDVLQNADILVFPPIAPEGQPLVILEAMSYGLPIIATPQGAIPETVIDGITGVIVPPGEPQILSKAVIELLQDPDRRKAMGSAARSRYHALYTKDQWIAKMRELFHDVAVQA